MNVTLSSGLECHSPAQPQKATDRILVLVRQGVGAGLVPTHTSEP